MALTTQQRTALRQFVGALLSDRREPFTLTKAQLDAAIAGIDDWIDTNAVSFNTSIPQPARSALTAAQKTELLYLIAKVRFTG